MRSQGTGPVPDCWAQRGSWSLPRSAELSSSRERGHGSRVESGSDEPRTGRRAIPPFLPEEDFLLRRVLDDVTALSNCSGAVLGR